MAPVTMMMRNKAVITPVILYKIIIATAVDGAPLPPPKGGPFLS
jgi:hypothetical protein